MFENVVRPEIRALKPYVPGRSIDEIREEFGLERVVKMASNENPLGVSNLVREALGRHADTVFRYPAGGNPRLVRALAALWNVPEGRLVVGNGSDEIIDMLVRMLATAGRDNVVCFRPCFSLYPIQSLVQGVEIRRQPVNEDFSFDFDRLLSLVDERTRLVFVTTPDNPSGHCPGPDEVRRLAERLPKDCLLVIDEAYMDFAPGDGETEADWSLFARGDLPENACVIRTFSKSYGLAGLRIGVGVLPEELAGYYWRARLPFSVNILAEEAVLAALQDVEFRRRTLETVREGRKFLFDGLKALGCRVWESRANFLMFEPPAGVPATTLYEGLLRRGVIVRALKSYELPDKIRVSVGNVEENRLFLEETASILGKRPCESSGKGLGERVMAEAAGTGRLIVTIDGPAGVGKTTMARLTARELGIAYLDTGAMFRTLALRLGEDMARASEDEIRRKAEGIRFSLEGQGEGTRILCDGREVGNEIRTEEVGRLASLFATVPVVREILKDAQRTMGRDTSLVVEGRDMGTVVFPDATCKIFLDADPSVRAKRRLEDMRALGRESSLEELESRIRERDERDRNRAVAPLRPAEDAFVIDTSNLTREEVLASILACVARCLDKDV